jgi:hypothetical protein
MMFVTVTDQMISMLLLFVVVAEILRQLYTRKFCQASYYYYYYYCENYYLIFRVF